MTLLQWQIQSGGVRACNVHRSVWPAGMGSSEHGHDYCELFWVEAGVVVHTWDGIEERLLPGDLVALVPGETHALRASAAGPAAIVNLSLAAADAARARRRLAPGQSWPWSGDRLRRRQVLVPAARHGLRHLLDLVDPRLPGSRDLLLLAVIHGLARGARGGLHALPGELRHGLLAALERDPAAGVASLARALRRSREGLTRACRRATGRPLADLVREWRLERAADLLRTTDQGIASIAVACGFSALGGFYKAFARHHGQPPGTWRLASARRTMR